MNIKGDNLKLIGNKKIQKIYKTKLSLFEKYDEENREYIFLGNLILDDGSETNKIIENNVIKETYSDIIWIDKTIDENNYSFIKFLERDKIIENDFLLNIIKKIKKDIIQSKNHSLFEPIKEEFENDTNIINKFIFVNISDKEIKNKSNIIKNIEDDFDWNNDDIIQILELNDLVKLYENKFSTKLSVDKATLNILSGKNNFLEFENPFATNTIVNKAYIFNLSAKSVKELYETYGNQILNLNLRYFKKKKNVDEYIKESINNPENFWYLNNGMVIICDDLEIGEKDIVLKNFSIINGGQTTYNISHTDFEKDFFILSKIICIKNWSSKENNKEAYELANKIAIASNRQKPIDNKDLISNLPLATLIKNTFAQNNENLNFKTYIETKVGSFKFDETAQTIYKPEHVFSLENLLQLNWTWEKIMPGTAKNAKAKIYKDEKILEKSLDEIYTDYQLYSELCYLFRTFDSFKKKDYTTRPYVKKDDWRRNVIKNCLMYNIVIIKFIFIYFKLKENGDDILSHFDDYESMIEFLESKKIKIKKLFRETFINLHPKEKRENLFNVLVSIEPESPFSDALMETREKLGINPSEIHNMVKKDSNIFEYVFSFIRYLKNNTDYQKMLKDIFAI